MRILPFCQNLKLNLLFVFLLFASSHSQAQFYFIDFAGTGAADFVDSVRVNNITQGTSLTMGGTDTLFLYGTVGLNDQIPLAENKIALYPNPAKNFSTLSVSVTKPGEYNISICNENGHLITGLGVTLYAGINQFEISGLAAGVYILQVAGERILSSKLIFIGSDQGLPAIRKVAGESIVTPMLKSGRGVIEMQYNHGDQLLFLCHAGIYSVVVPLIATGHKTINALFVPCTDGQGIHYPVVHIGAQTWMARNLETTKYSDGSNIPQVLNDIQWLNQSAGAYCWYDNNALNKWIYGALYNWYATNPETNGNKNLCPEGWRVPTATDFDELNYHLGYYWTNGGKLKETGFLHWNSPNTAATNEVGFTGLPGGQRTNMFREMGKECMLWSATLQTPMNYPHCRGLRYDSEGFAGGVTLKYTGMSVRCIKND